jgi:superfamily II DNA helicase RecQ
MSATIPPHLVWSFAEAFKINEDELTEIRSSTDRPEIGMHVVRIPLQAMLSDALNALIRLTDALSARLDEEERMLVFFSSNHEAETYAGKTGSAVYHSKLYEQGNTRADNLQRWDQGNTSIMACTTAFAQGVDRPNVRFVVIFKPTFGLLTINQMLGRAGRDGKPSHVFFLTVGNVTTSSINVKEAKDRCLKELELLVNGNDCRRRINMQYMDGAALGKPCVEARGMKCDICDPGSEMQRLAMNAVRPPTCAPNTTSDRTHTPLAIPGPERPVFGSTSSLHNAPPSRTQVMALASKLTQGSDDLYGSCHITTSQEEALHVMECHHHAACAIPPKAILPLHPLHPKPIQIAAYKVEYFLQAQYQ